MGYVCSQLSQANEQGLQTCLQWQEQNSLGLPSLTASEAADLTLYIILACVVAWCFKLLGNFIKSFK